MRRLRLGAAILNQTPLDWPGNRQRIIDALDQARQCGVSVLCLPELCITGYGCEDMFLSPAVWKTAWQTLQQIVPATRGMLAAVGLPLYVTNGVYNTICIVCDGQIAGFVPKQHLAGDGLHYEPRWFRAWPKNTIAEYRCDGHSWPVGDLLFEADGVRFGMEICEDAWVADRTGRRMAACGVDVILNPSASHFAFGKHAVRHRFVLEGSRAFGVGYVYTNLVGNEAGRAIYDGGALIACAGDLLVRGPRFRFDPVDVVTADVDIELARMRRAGVHSLTASLSPDVQERIVQIPGHLQPSPDTPCPPPEEDSPACDDYDDFTCAIALGLFDYLRKSRSQGFVVSMSGGADSSATACLVRCMIERALQDLGPHGTAAALNHIPDLPDSPEADAWMNRLFTGVYQATRNSSETTLQAARQVTEAVGGTFCSLDIDEIVQANCRLVEHTLGRRLEWDRDDITLQNIQARTRAPLVWMFANLNHALLLSTSNRSEAAVGYATMDGDTSGGLSPIAGIDKAFLREWLRRMETRGSGGCPPVPELALVNAQEPTAELRPASHGQTDESDLMPYPILDEIEGLAIRDKYSPAEVLHALRDRHPDTPPDRLTEWVNRFFTLWCRNQWKRERYAPSFHVDDKNLDPRTWCRFPILSGGFREELDNLRNSGHTNEERL